MEFEARDIQFRHPFRGFLAGQSGSGKSTWIRNFLNVISIMTDTIFDKIIYVYHIDTPMYQEIRKEHPNIIWIQGYLDTLVDDHLSNNQEKKLLILDDLMVQLANSKNFAELTTTLSHHLNTSVLYTFQNTLYQGKQMRTIHLNSTFYVLFKSPRDMTQVKTLANQLGVLTPETLKRCYKQATAHKYSYLVVDLQMETPDPLRLRAGVLPGEQLVIFTG